MKILKQILLSLFTMILGMYGGQKDKKVRRFGIPGLAFLTSLKIKGFDWKDFLVCILIIPILCSGYGENSILMQYIGNDAVVRLVYGAILGLPFFIYGRYRGTVAVVALSLAYLVKAGSLGHVSWFGDWLIEDMVRYITLGILLSFNIFTKRSK